jgi:hypothetical protein
VPTPEVLARDRVRDGAFDIGMFRAAWRRAGAAVHGSTAASSLEAALRAKRVALEETVAASLEAAEELTRARKRAVRGLS